jgi:sec-independent protein translocase protein TatA
MPNLRWQELLIIVALVLLLFGAKRLPDAARGLGRSMRIFKAETKGLVDGDDGEDDNPPRATDASTDTTGSAAPSALESGESQNRNNVDTSTAADPAESADRPRTNG